VLKALNEAHPCAPTAWSFDVQRDPLTGLISGMTATPVPIVPAPVLMDIEVAP
jgi:hypothetical protein